MITRENPHSKAYLLVRAAKNMEVGESVDVNAMVVAWNAAVQSAKAHLGQGHKTTLYAATRLGAALIKAGRLKTAVSFMAPSASVAQKSLGEDHPCVYHFFRLIAVALDMLERFDEAAVFWEMAVAVSVKIHKQPHTYTMYCRQRAACAKKRVGQLKMT